MALLTALMALLMAFMTLLTAFMTRLMAFPTLLTVILSLLMVVLSYLKVVSAPQGEILRILKVFRMVLDIPPCGQRLLVCLGRPHACDDRYAGSRLCYGDVIQTKAGSAKGLKARTLACF